MSELTINPNSSPIGGSGSPSQPVPSQPKQAPSAPSSSSDVADSVTLSGVNQTGNSDGKPSLSESDAQDQVAKLRQQLNNHQLSGTARQNQAIVALLR